MRPSSSESPVELQVDRDGPCCPSCGESVRRIHRRAADRIISWLRPLRRYRCDNPACKWEGNLPYKEYD